MLCVKWTGLLRAITFFALVVMGWGSFANASLTYDTGHGNDGTAFIIINGSIDSDDDLSKFLSAVQGSNAKVAFFNSPGGNIAKAMALGRLIRSLHLMTVQLKTAECASACSLAFMGGMPRMADPGSIGVHKSSFADTTGMSVADAVSAIQQMTAEVIAYMTEMGVDPTLLQLSLKYDSDDIRYLSGSEMEQYHLALNSSRSTSTPAPSESAAPPVPENPAPPPSTMPQPSPMPAPAVASLPPSPEQPPSFAIPRARTGRIQSYDGKVSLRAEPTARSPIAVSVLNGSPVTILEDTGKWYRLRVGMQVGYVFHSLVWVREFNAAPYGRQFIQVKSFDNYADTERYVRTSPLPVIAYLASNGWFAITLNRTFDPDAAEKLVDSLKASGSIPDDSIATWGNAFVRKML